MRYTQSEKLEIIRLVETSDLSVKTTLLQLQVSRASFYRWYRAYVDHGAEGFSGPDAAIRPAKPCVFDLDDPWVVLELVMPVNAESRTNRAEARVHVLAKLNAEGCAKRLDLLLVEHQLHGLLPR